MKQARFDIVTALIFCLAISGTASGASFDFGAILGAGKDLLTATKGVDEKDEILIGRDLAGQILGAAPLVNDNAVQTYVNRVGRWIASQSERPNLPWHFGIIETAGVNAFATPGGYILITRGLYEILDNESQLAGVLGHEIGHVIKRHHIDLMQKGNLLSAGARVGQAALESRGGVGRTMVGNLVVPNVADVVAKGLDKNAEFDADQLGIVLAVRAGYSPSGLVEVLQKLQARSSADPSLELLFATHPHPTERLQKIGDLIAPRVSSLPAGEEPVITRISGSARPARATAQRPMPAGARALNAEPAQAAAQEPAAPSRGSNPLPIDPGQLLPGLRGIFGR
jgi:beta-barrel assembly-enhancing protease